MIHAPFNVMLQGLLAVNCALTPSTDNAARPNAFEEAVATSPAHDSLPTTVGWKLLASMDSRKGIVPEALLALQGKQVRIPGFVVPLEDLNSSVKEFLLVPYYGACVHTPPPPPNQMVFVQLKSNVKVALFDVVWIEGMLEIIKIESPYGMVGYRLQGQKLTPYQTNP